MQIAPYYRNYELPWNEHAALDERYRKIQRGLLLAFLVFGSLIPLLPRVDSPLRTPADLPERVVQLIVDQPLPPPPPPPPPPEDKPPEPLQDAPAQPRPSPVPPKPQDVQQKVRQVGLLALQDDLADLRQVDPNQLAKADLTTVGPDVRSERNLITSRVGTASGGINTANLSRGYGGGVGAIGTHTTASVAAPTSVVGQGDGRSDVRRSGSGKPSRSREEIETVFDRNKGALYALYTRAQRENPELAGKLVLEITISPTGDVTAVRVVSSELSDPELERKILARVRLFRFEAKDVATITANKPIDFFPA